MLAYSTLSQLAYMVAGLSLGPAGRNAAFFHLFTHAFFKALLFLGAGSVIHAVHSNNMSDMGGITEADARHVLDVPDRLRRARGHRPLAGFWSKDELLVARLGGARAVLFAIMLAVAVLTAFYTTRMVVLTFFGTYQGHGHPHESPPSMAGPLVVLAGASVVVGFLGAPQLRAPFSGVGLLRATHEADFVAWIALVGTLAALAGILIGWKLYRGAPRADPLTAFGLVRGTCSSTATTSTTSTCGTSSTRCATGCPRPCTGSTSTCWTAS